ncbi:MAG: polysaccharide deacetylase family protein [Sphingomonadales bacterium]|nr:polysaccharide deacetylase family protein [Sphingomonadales bacterium]MBD3773974.1 polysaccharide deacetylase family protein [Paracoccaceae bacterium]
MERKITDLPAPGSRFKFPADFGQRALLTVDTEEEFDWNAPFSATDHGLDHVGRLNQFQQFCEGQGVSPVYLVDWPIANSPEAIEIIGGAVAAGKAEVGIQLHPWVNPPHYEGVNTYNSFAGNLPEALERQKLTNLRDAIEKNFNVAPRIYRAGRYGLGDNTARLLKEVGVRIDSSVRARFDYSAGHGPNYEHHPVTPYWVDEEHGLLELPLTTVFWGLLRQQGDTLYPQLGKWPRLQSLAARLGLLERISLTPEGVTADEALRGIDIALDDRLPVLVLSFHSPSIDVGHTPYVRSEEDLDALYTWWRRIFAYLDQRQVKPTTVRELLQVTGLE